MRNLFNTGIWAAEHPLHGSAAGRRVLHLLRVFAFAWKSFWGDELLVRATALAYATILAIVPLLAVAFAFYSAFPGLSGVYEEIRQVIYQYLAPGASEVVVESLDRFIGNIHSGAVAGVGIALLFLAILGFMGAIEYSFNTIWSVRQGRKIIDRIMYYIAIIVVGPLLLGLSLRTMIRSVLRDIPALGIVESSMPAIWNVSTSLVLSVVAITVLYVVIPNTKVHWRAALAGGVLAGILFELAKSGYTFFVTNIMHYSTIYGAVGAIPVFFVWIYLIWLVILFGGEFAFAWQNIDLHCLKLAHRDTSQSFHEWLAASICVVVVRRFDRSEPGPSLEELAEMFSVPPDLLGEIVDKLDGAGIIASTDRGHLPSRDPHTTTLGDVVFAMRHSSPDDEKSKPDSDTVVGDALAALEDETLKRYNGITLEALANADDAELLIRSANDAAQSDSGGTAPPDRVPDISDSAK